MVEAYWNIGKQIVTEEQNGKGRATYGKEIMKNISKELIAEFSKGFSERNIRNFRQFYITFPNIEIWQTLSAKFSWSHFQLVLKISDPKAQEYYLTEAAANIWSVRTLDRNIATMYYQRLVSSQIKEEVIHEMQLKNKDLQHHPLEFIQLCQSLSLFL